MNTEHGLAMSAVQHLQQIGRRITTRRQHADEMEGDELAVGTGTEAVVMEH
jgi:hypothetical protein